MIQKPMTFDELIKEKTLPVVVIDHNSFFILVNDAFEKAYGWTAKDLLGNSVTKIIPPYLQDAHQVGFSRFLVTEQPTLMNKPLPLSILYRDGTVKDAEHYITAQKKKDRWQFAASITPSA